MKKYENSEKRKNETHARKKIDKMNKAKKAKKIKYAEKKQTKRC